MNKRSAVLLLLAVILLLVLGQIAARTGAKRSVESGGINIFYIASYFCFLARGILWVLLLRKRPLAWSYPLLALAHPAVLLISHFMFEEPIGAGAIAGSVLIVAGVSLVGLGREG